MAVSIHPPNSSTANFDNNSSLSGVFLVFLLFEMAS